ncbi:TPA: hypothetical protein NIH63_002572 [Pseudomonas aeruginosa]|nr:hypothetical protein [Pseudomonas aeruginosa]
MSSTQLIEQCVTRLRGIIEALDNIHDTSPHRWSTALDDKGAFNECMVFARKRAKEMTGKKKSA